MKSQVFNVKENHVWLNVILPVSIVLFMVVLIFANKIAKNSYKHSDHDQKSIELQSNLIVKQDVLKSDNRIYNPVGKSKSEIQYAIANQTESHSTEKVSESSITIGKESSIDNTLEMRIKEYLQPEVEKPLELEDWMMNENYWCSEPNATGVANKN